jgi:hypothetical protein
MGAPLKPHLSCAHLGVGQAARPGGAYFARCGLGTAEERFRWAEALRHERLDAIRRARLVLSQALRPSLLRLRALMSGAKRPVGDADRGQHLEATEALGAAFEKVVGEQTELILAAGIEPEQILECFREALAEFRARPVVGEWRMAEALVTRYPWPIIAFFRPDLIREAGFAGARPPEKGVSRPAL